MYNGDSLGSIVIGSRSDEMIADDALLAVRDSAVRALSYRRPDGARESRLDVAQLSLPSKLPSRTVCSTPHGISGVLQRGRV